MVGGEVKRQPLAIVLEDCHRMDSASLALAMSIAKDIQPLLMILSSRPPIEGTDKHLGTVRSAMDPSARPETAGARGVVT